MCISCTKKKEKTYQLLWRDHRFSFRSKIMYNKIEKFIYMYLSYIFLSRIKEIPS